MDIEHLRQGLIMYLILVASLSVHEWAHAITADRLGDYTPRSQGRVTLNPIAHIDPIGTVLIPLMMILYSPGFALIGWGKPVMINPRNFRQPVRDDLLVTMAGPGSNLVICFITTIVGALILRLVPDLAGLVVQVITINCVLIVFNLIPIPPLDGSHVLKHAIGMREETYIQLSRWGFIILIVLINIPQFRYVFTYGILFLRNAFIYLMQIMMG